MDDVRNEMGDIEAVRVGAGADDAQIAEALEAHQRELMVRWALLQGGEVEDRPELVRTVVGLPVPYTNQTGAARLTAESADPEIAATEELLRRHGVPGAWWMRLPAHPPDLGERLVSRGWTFQEEMPWMAAPIVDVLARLPSEPPELSVETVAGPDAQERWLAAMTAGFGMGPDGRLAMTRLADAVGVGPERPWTRFAGTVDGRGVASSGLMVSARLAGIYNVATDPAFRRRGFAAAMTAAALREARRRGYEVAILGASPMGESVYRNLGFREVCRLAFYEFDPRASR